MSRTKKLQQELQERAAWQEPEEDRQFLDDRYRRDYDEWIEAIETATDSGAEHANRK
jgi:hypothetical protein